MELTKMIDKELAEIVKKARLEWLQDEIKDINEELDLVEKTEQALRERKLDLINEANELLNNIVTIGKLRDL